MVGLRVPNISRCLRRLVPRSQTFSAVSASGGNLQQVDWFYDWMVGGYHHLSGMAPLCSGPPPGMAPPGMAANQRCTIPRAQGPSSVPKVMPAVFGHAKFMQVDRDGECLFHALAFSNNYDGGALRIEVADVQGCCLALQVERHPSKMGVQPK